MKKLLGIVVLGLLWCNVVNALTQEEAINNYLSDRELDPIEGVWIAQDNVILSKCYITKYKNSPKYEEKEFNYKASSTST